MVTSTPTLEPTAGELTFEELQLAARNRGMPLEALRYDVSRLRVCATQSLRPACTIFSSISTSRP